MPIDMKALARAGAQTRIQELLAELDEIRRAFPGIGGVGRAAGRKAAPVGRAAPRRRKPMTAAQKKAVGERMKKYWAARRKAAGKG